MRVHRLTRLALLTQGAALVGAGVAGAACGKESGLTGRDHEPIHINATVDPVDASVPPPDAARGTLSASADGAAVEASSDAGADARAKPVVNRPRMNATAARPPAPPAPTTKPSGPNQGR